MCQEVGISGDGLNQDMVDTIFSALSSALNDYTNDSRGDIGVM